MSEQQNHLVTCDSQCDRQRFGCLTEQCDASAESVVFPRVRAIRRRSNQATLVQPHAWPGRWLTCMIADAVSPDTLAALYLWNPLVIAAAVGGSTGGLENAAVFAALSAASHGDARMAAAALAGASYLGLHPVLLAVRLPLLLLIFAQEHDVLLCCGQ